MKKIILTVMSLAFLSSAANIFAYGNASTKVTNKTANPITLQRQEFDNVWGGLKATEFKDIDTIQPGESKSITFSPSTNDGRQVKYRFPTVREKDLNTPFDVDHIRELKKGLTFHD